MKRMVKSKKRRLSAILRLKMKVNKKFLLPQILMRKYIFPGFLNGCAKQSTKLHLP